MTTDDDIRDSPGYRKEMARLKTMLASSSFKPASRDELHEAWLEFGQHNWLWQLVHRKPSARRAGRAT